MSMKIPFKKSFLSQPNMRLAVLLSVLAILVTVANIIYTIKLQQTSSPSPVVLAESDQPIKLVTALGQIEPEGKSIRLGAPPNLGGAKIIRLNVKEGDLVKANDIIAVLENEATLKAAVDQANQDIKVARADLDIINAGAKTGEIQSQKATIRRLKAQLKGEMLTNQANIQRIIAEQTGEKISQQATVNRLKAELANANTEYQRNQNLAEEGAISDSELDGHRLTKETSEERLQEANARLNQTIATLDQEINQAKADFIRSQQTIQQEIEEAMSTLDEISEVRDVDIQRADAEVQRAKASLIRAQEDLELIYVRAPFTGEVLKIYTYPGETVITEEGIVELGKTQKMMVTAEVYESDISKIQIGQSALITSENGSFKGEIQGKVSDISPLINRQGVFNTDPASDVDNRIVEVKIALEPEDNSKVKQLTYSQVLVKILL